MSGAAFSERFFLRLEFDEFVRLADFILHAKVHLHYSSGRGSAKCQNVYVATGKPRTVLFVTSYADDTTHSIESSRVSPEHQFKTIHS